MKINKLASAISRGKWLIEPRTYAIERARAVKFLSGDFNGSVADIKEPELDTPFAIKAGNYFDITDEQPDIFGVAEAGSVAVIPICGTIMKYDYCGTPGTDTLGAWLKAAIASPQIDAIVLLVNSGGGSVEGTGEFADIVLSSAKTVFTFCDGMIASAAYWIGSAAKEIWVSHSTVEAGSIGVAASFFDDSKAMEEAGYKDVYINADTSPDKNMEFFDAISGNEETMKTNSLNPLDQIFMGTVKSNRGDRLKLTDVTIKDVVYQEPLTGKMYLAKPAIENGLIDGICTLEQCVEKALQFKEDNNNINLKSNNMAVNTDNEKQVKKSGTFLEKLMALISSEKDEEKADDDDDAKKADDEDAASIEADKKSDDDDAKDKAENKDDVDDDNDDDSDEDDIEVNGKKISLKDPSAIKAAFSEMTEAANKEIANRDALLAEANELIAENIAALSKSAEEVKKEIKSTFTLKGSSRANKIGLTDDDDNSQAFKPAENSVAEHVLNRAMAKQKAAAKQFGSIKKK